MTDHGASASENAAVVVADAAAMGEPSHPNIQGPARGTAEPQGPNPGPALDAAISPEATPCPATASTIGRR